jgi:hypothetical protein
LGYCPSCCFCCCAILPRISARSTPDVLQHDVAEHNSHPCFHKHLPFQQLEIHEPQRLVCAADRQVATQHVQVTGPIRRPGQRFQLQQHKRAGRSSTHQSSSM